MGMFWSVHTLADSCTTQFAKAISIYSMDNIVPSLLQLLQLDSVSAEKWLEAVRKFPSLRAYKKATLEGKIAKMAEALGVPEDAIAEHCMVS